MFSAPSSIRELKHSIVALLLQHFKVLFWPRVKINLSHIEGIGGDVIQKSEGLVSELQGHTCAIEQSCGDKLPVRGEPGFQGWDVPLAKSPVSCAVPSHR